MNHILNEKLNQFKKPNQGIRSTSSNIIHQGWLEKHNGNRKFTSKNWGKRWIIVKKKQLDYYKSSDTTPMGVIDLDGYTIEESKLKPNSFAATKVGYRTYHFCATTLKEMKMWIQVINKAITLEDMDTGREELFQTDENADDVVSCVNHYSDQDENVLVADKSTLDENVDIIITTEDDMRPQLDYSLHSAALDLLPCNSLLHYSMYNGESDDDDEVNRSIDDGTSICTESLRTKRKTAVCIIKPPQGLATGFIGRIVLDGKDSLVLVTNYHVMIRGLDKKIYKSPKEINNSMKKEIEKNARNSEIKLKSGTFGLSKILVKNSLRVSPTTALDFFIMEVNEEELRKNWYDVNPIDLNRPETIKNDDNIQIFQHPHGGSLACSVSQCQIVESINGSASLMTYTGVTGPGSSGGLILKQVHHDMVVVGLHRGGYFDNWDGHGSKRFSYGSLFTEIVKCINEDWQPTNLSVKEQMTQHKERAFKTATPPLNDVSPPPPLMSVPAPPPPPPPAVNRDLSGPSTHKPSGLVHPLGPRVSLMEDIRKAGGIGKAGLKNVEAKKDKAPAGGDLLGDLQAALNKRRKRISSFQDKEDVPKNPNAGLSGVMGRVAQMIPPPTIESTDAADDDDWDKSITTLT